MARTIEMMQRSIRNGSDLSDVVLGAQSAHQRGCRFGAVGARILRRIEAACQIQPGLLFFQKSFQYRDRAKQRFKIAIVVIVTDEEKTERIGPGLSWSWASAGSGALSLVKISESKPWWRATTGLPLQALSSRAKASLGATVTSAR